MPHHVDLLIFDLDGTLVDTRLDIANSVNYAIQKLGLPTQSLAEVVDNVGDGMLKLLERTLPAERQSEIEDAIKFFREHYQDHLLDNSRLYPGIDEVLHRFANKKKAIISNKPEAFTKAIAAGLELANGFECILGGDSIASLKPDPAPLLSVMANLEILPDKTIMIGDSLSDIQAGKAAGTLTCAVSYGFKDRVVLEKGRPDLLIDDAIELLRFVA